MATVKDTNSFRDPYPTQDWEEITDFEFNSPLHLLRLADSEGLVPAPGSRLPKPGEPELDRESNYIVSNDYRFSYVLKYKSGGSAKVRSVVPVGMLTDLTSVPRIARTFVGRVGLHLEAAIIHDWLYIAWQDLTENGIPREPKRRDFDFANELMLVAMEASKVSWVERNAIHQSVKLFGWPRFKRKDPLRYADLSGVPDIPAHPVVHGIAVAAKPAPAKSTKAAPAATDKS